MKRTFAYNDTQAGGTSNKFWWLEQHNQQVTVGWGRAGSQGQTKVHSFDSEAAATLFADKLVGSKLKQGYVEQTAAV